MENLKNKSNSKIKAVVALIGILSGLMLFTSLVLHTNLLNLADSIVDFATHHIFLMSLASLILLVVSLKVYESMDIAIDSRYNKKNNIGFTRAKRKRKVLMTIIEGAYYKSQQLKSYSIDKNSIKDLKFEDNDVLDKNDAIERMDNLQKAAMLGNAIKHKVRIFFKDQQSNKHVETTVWHADEKYISLKGGITLPVKSIYKIEI